MNVRIHQRVCRRQHSVRTRQVMVDDRDIKPFGFRRGNLVNGHDPVVYRHHQPIVNTVDDLHRKAVPFREPVWKVHFRHDAEGHLKQKP